MESEHVILLHGLCGTQRCMLFGFAPRWSLEPGSGTDLPKNARAHLQVETGNEGKWAEFSWKGALEPNILQPHDQQPTFISHERFRVYFD